MNNPSTPPDVGRFLAGIAALIWDPAAEKYLLLRRAGDRDFGADLWECVTGRVDQGESFALALHREVREEIGVAVAIDFLLGVTHFYRGPERAEYELLGATYVCRLLPGQQPQFGAEHSAARWVTAAEAYDFLPDPYWLRTLIERAELVRRLAPAEVVAALQADDFEV